jgi:filamentous hemagglutinin family protein
VIIKRVFEKIFNRKTPMALAIALLICNITPAYPNPQYQGALPDNVTVTQQPNNTQVINVGQENAILKWQSFNIAPGETTQFIQPSASSVTLNRIDPQQGASQIFGQLSANGKLILVNQAGIFFGPGARVDVAGLIASTSDISNDNFLNANGHYIFDQDSAIYNGAIVNQGFIRAGQYGLVALVGRGVSNTGTIEAHLGNVYLGSGNKFTVDLYGDQLINFSVDEAAARGGVDANGQAVNGVNNSGSILADGGRVVLTARAAQGVIDNVVNMSGVVQANSVGVRNGEIILGGGPSGKVKVSGTIKAKGVTANSKGGVIKVLGNEVQIANTAVIDASGNSGGGEILIGGNYQGRGPEQNAINTMIDEGSTIHASALDNGAGGKVIVWADNNTAFGGSIAVTGGVNGGDGGFVETSGHNITFANGRVDARALSGLGATGTWLIDPWNVTISNAATANDALSANSYTPSATGANINVADLVLALNTANITVTTGTTGAEAGNITVASPITWTSANNLTLTAANNITINAGAGVTSAAGGLVLNATNAIVINAPIQTKGLTLSAKFDLVQGITTGPSGTINVGDFTLTYGYWYQLGTLPSFNVSGNFDLSPGNGSQFLRGLSGAGTTVSPYLLTDIYGVQGINSNPSVSYTLNNDIDASTTFNWSNAGRGFVPIDNFGGTLDGANKTINNLYIASGSENYVGFMRTVNGTGIIKNLGLVNPAITATLYTGGSAGGLVGLNSGTIQNSYVSGGYVAGGGVSSSTSSTSLGGLVGKNSGSISDSYSSAQIQTNYDRSVDNIGGLVGWNFGAGAISRSYSSGNINLGVNGYVLYAGGLVGKLDSGASIQDSYSANKFSYDPSANAT